MERRQHKDWTASVREAQNRKEPVHLPDSLKKYFTKDVNFPDIYFRGRRGDDRGGAQGSNYGSGLREKGLASQNALGHVSRNNPHPYRIVFPFQTGDRLCSYMIWQPVERGPALPPIPSPQSFSQDKGKDQRLTPQKSREVVTSMRSRAQTQFNPYVSTYTAEIANMPMIRKQAMGDHFATTSKQGVFSHRLKVH